MLDLWAMALLMLAMLASTATVSGAGTEAAHSGEHGHQILLSLGGLSISVVAAWTAVRLWMLVRTGFQRHSVISALVCGGGLAWMLLL